MNQKTKKAKYNQIGDVFADRVLSAVVKVSKGLYKELSQTEVSLKNFAPALPDRRTYLTKSMAVLMLFSVTVGLTGIGAAAPNHTLAYYSDEEKSEDNVFLAGEIDFLLESTSFTPTTTAISLSPGESVHKEITVIPGNSNPFKYVASTTDDFEGDIEFCNGLDIEAKLEGKYVFSGSMLEMLTEATTTLDSWELWLSMDENFQNSVCKFHTDFNGSQERHNYELGEAYNDTESVWHMVSSWGFRINKVYYDVAPDRGEEKDNEWVEIYNQTDVPLDIDGWELCDNKSCDTLSASEMIPPMGYGFITASSTTASTTLPAFWYLPEEVVEINIPDESIGNGLGNDNDMLILKRPDGLIVDQMNWGDSPDTDWDNYNDDVWHPGSVDVAEGNALARVPSGHDTNEPSDFIEIIPPSVDLIFPDESGSYIWYWGEAKTILWEAINNNGPDGDLNMSLFYVKDVNHSDEIDDGDTMITIAETTENDGEYDWTVPSGFVGFIWIFLVGTGPENPMLNSGTISGDIWDPIPVFVGEEGVDPNSVDMEAPVIDIRGNNPAYLELGASYSDLGATVTDNVDTNLGANAEGDVDTSTLGEYEIVYTSTDSAGNIGTAVRKVVVYDPEVGIPEPEPASEPVPLTEEEAILEEEAVLEETVEGPADPEPEPTSGTGGGGSGSSGESSGEEPAPEEDIATTTPEIIIEEDTTASTTPELSPVEEAASTTPEIIEEEISTTTPEVIGEETASTTPEILTEEETATTTEEVLPEDAEEPAPEEPVVEEPVVVEEPAIEPELVTEPEPQPEPEPEPAPEPEAPTETETPGLPEEEALLEENTNDTTAE